MCYRIAGISYQALKAYFRGLIFVIYPEHIITVAYNSDFHGLIFRFGGLAVTKIKSNESFMLYGMFCDKRKTLNFCGLARILLFAQKGLFCNSDQHF